MIKPNTLCMIRGIKPNKPGHTANGMIVTTISPETVAGLRVWYTQPELHIENRRFRGVLEENLFPLQNPTDDVVDTISQLKEPA
jgi:hypothetical protein